MNKETGMLLQELKKQIEKNVAGESARSEMLGTVGRIYFIEQEHAMKRKVDVWSFTDSSKQSTGTVKACVQYEGGYQLAYDGAGACKIKAPYPAEREGKAFDKSGVEHPNVMSLNLMRALQRYDDSHAAFSIDEESYKAAVKKAAALKKEYKGDKSFKSFYVVDGYLYDIAIFNRFVSMMSVIGAEKLCITGKGEAVAVGVDGQLAVAADFLWSQDYIKDKYQSADAPDGYEEGCGYYIHVKTV